MWIVLCHQTDVGAAWAAVGLREVGLAPVEVVLARQLAVGATLAHTVTGGESAVRLLVRDGPELRDGAVAGVLNRLQGVPGGASDLPEPDRAYADAERTSATVSWLRGLDCPVLNPPHGNAIGGRWRRDPAWQQLAVGAGLAAAGWAWSSRTGSALVPRADAVALVVGDTVVGSPDPGIDARLVALAAASGTPLLEVGLVEAPSGWAVCGADHVPDLPRFGSSGLMALARGLGYTR